MPIIDKEKKLFLGSFLALRRGSDAVAKNLQDHLSKNNLTLGQFGILEALFHLGTMSQRKLGGKILSSKGNITFIINNLEKRKLVERVNQSQADGRINMIHLTQSGKEFMSDIVPQHLENIVTIMSALNLDELIELKRLCKKLGMSLTNNT